MSDKPAEPAHITEAKRAAARTGFVAGAVIWVLITGLLVFEIVRDAQRPGPYPQSLWIGVIASLFAGAMIVRRGLKLRRPK